MPRTMRSGFWGDINKLANDALHTAVAPVEGPINQGLEDFNDFGNTVKDIWDNIGKAFGNENAADVGSEGILDTWTGRTRNGKRFRPETPPDSTDSSSTTTSGGSNGNNMDVDWVFPPGQQGSAAHNNANNNVNNAIVQMSRGGSDGEVPIAKVPRAISKIHPDHFNIRLPYVWRANVLNSSCTNAHDEPLVLIRLNSIYDVMKEKNSRIDYQVNPNTELASAALTAANANDPVAAAIARAVIDQTAAFNPTTTASGAGGPQGRNIWQAHFKYYRVLRTDVKITFFNKNCEMLTDTGSGPANVGPLRNHYIVGFELVDEDAQLSDTTEMFLMTKNAQRGILPPAHGISIPLNSAGQSYPICSKVSHAVMNYSYDPLNWNYHVEQTSGVETRWTAIGANPTLNHLLAVRMFHLDTAAQANAGWYNLGCMVQIEFEVQFMECLDSFYKTQYNPTATNS